MQLNHWYQDPCNECDAFCCKTYPILESENMSFFWIPIKVAGAICENLDGNKCWIYNEREQNWYGNCIPYSCYWLWPLLDTWMSEKSLPLENWGNFLEEIRQYMHWYFSIRSKSEFEKILPERIKLFHDRVQDLLIFCPTDPREYSLYWQWRIADLIVRRREV